MSATDGVEATEPSDEYDFDVVLSDISIPGCDGIQFLRSVHAREPDIPMVLNPRRTGRGYHPEKSAGVRGVSLSHQDRRLTPPRTGVKRMACLRRTAAMKRKDAELLEHQLGDRYLRSMRASLGRPSQIRWAGRAVRDEAAEGVLGAPCTAPLFATLDGTDLLAAHQISDHSPLATKAARVVGETTEPLPTRKAGPSATAFSSNCTSASGSPWAPTTEAFGRNLLQGHLLAGPGPTFPEVDWRTRARDEDGKR